MVFAITCPCQSRYKSRPLAGHHVAQRYFATINPGLEAALLAEVRELGAKRATELDGGVEFDATNAVFYEVALRMRCANRLWMRIDEFRARDAPELFNKTKRYDWSRVIPPNVPVDVRAVSRASHLIHTDRIARAVTDGINDSLGRTSPTSGAPLTVLARLVDNRCELSLDASGDLHYRRGYKTDAVAAPLRESVAAAILRTIEWAPGQSLVDPFCGSGTLVIEAAQQSLGIAAGGGRAFDFTRWANFRADLWEQVSETIRSTPAEQLSIFGSDIDPKAIEASRHNAARAQVADSCAFAVGDAAQLEPPPVSPGWIVTNPPWNLRLADPGHDALTAFVARFHEQFEGWRLALVAPRRWSSHGARPLAKFDLGGIPVTLWGLEA